MIIWYYWEHTHVLLQTALVSWSVRFLSIILLSVLHVKLMFDWLSFLSFFPYVCVLVVVSFSVCTSADVANKHVQKVVCDSLPTKFPYVCIAVSMSVCQYVCVCVSLCVVWQQAKREVQKFVDKMVTGKEAWADIQRMKQATGPLHGVLQPILIAIFLLTYLLLSLLLSLIYQVFS